MSKMKAWIHKHYHLYRLTDEQMAELNDELARAAQEGAGDDNSVGEVSPAPEDKEPRDPSKSSGLAPEPSAKGPLYRGSDPVGFVLWNVFKGVRRE